MITEDSLNEGILSKYYMLTSFKFYTEIKLLVDNDFMINLTALIDSGADLSLIPTKYFEKTTHSLRHAGGEKLEINFKLPEAYICNNRVCIPESFLLVKKHNKPSYTCNTISKKYFSNYTHNEKYLEGTYNNQKVSFQFITKPQTKILNEIKDVILRKFNQINFLTQEINTCSIDYDLKNPKLQD
uniref:Peptidase A2 domain-containing protein n=1 Tax=Kalanchoe fedtschenkoi TaxID=63787 RepID=A0A7N0VCW3_KALFE